MARRRTWIVVASATFCVTVGLTIDGFDRSTMRSCWVRIAVTRKLKEPCGDVRIGLPICLKGPL